MRGMTSVQVVCFQRRRHGNHARLQFVERDL
jgi:hypothetical protein